MAGARSFSAGGLGRMGVLWSAAACFIGASESVALFGDGGLGCHWRMVRRRSGRVRVCPLCRTLPALGGLGVRSSSQRLGRVVGAVVVDVLFWFYLCGGTLPLRGGLPARRPCAIASLNSLMMALSCSLTVAALFGSGLCAGSSPPSLRQAQGRLISLPTRRGGRGLLRMPAFRWTQALTPALSLRERELCGRIGGLAVF